MTLWQMNNTQIHSKSVNTVLPKKPAKYSFKNHSDIDLFP